MFPPENYANGLVSRGATRLHDLRAETGTSNRFTHYTKGATCPGEKSSVYTPEKCLSLWRCCHITCIMSLALSRSRSGQQSSVMGNAFSVIQDASLP